MPCAAGMSLAQAVRAASSQLAAAGIASPRSDAQALLAHVLGLDAVDFHTRLVTDTSAMAAADLACYQQLLDRRCARQPLQHITGLAHFRHLTLQVGPGVFVPRPETELVAGQAIDYAQQLTRPTLVDLCTGSGAIALSVASEVAGAQVYAVELDASAYTWTVRNVDSTASQWAAGSQVHVVKGDARTALDFLDGQVDVVVSNPPYIPPGAVPQDAEVRLHDPQVALYGLGSDGLEVPRGIARAAARLLAPGGLFVMEHAEVQAQAARDMLAQLPDPIGGQPAFTHIATECDLTGRPRMVLARRAGSRQPVQASENMASANNATDNSATDKVASDSMASGLLASATTASASDTTTSATTTSAGRQLADDAGTSGIFPQPGGQSVAGYRA